MGSDADEITRLRRAFDELPKVPGHGDEALLRHNNILPEWVMMIIAEPYHRFEELDPAGDRQTVLVGRVPESSQWIKLVFVGDPESGRFLTAYNDRRLQAIYGGRPWNVP